MTYYPSYLPLIIVVVMKRTYLPPTAELFTWHSGGPLDVLISQSVYADDLPIMDFDEGGEMPDTER